MENIIFTLNGKDIYPDITIYKNHDLLFSKNREPNYRNGVLNELIEGLKNNKEIETETTVTHYDITKIILNEIINKDQEILFEFLKWLDAYFSQSKCKSLIESLFMFGVDQFKYFNYDQFPDINAKSLEEAIDNIKRTLYLRFLNYKIGYHYESTIEDIFPANIEYIDSTKQKIVSSNICNQKIDSFINDLVNFPKFNETFIKYFLFISVPNNNELWYSKDYSKDFYKNCKVQYESGILHITGQFEVNGTNPNKKEIINKLYNLKVVIKKSFDKEREV